MSLLLRNPLLRRYWFSTSEVTGYGVTAYSVEDAEAILRQFKWPKWVYQEIVDVIEDVDLQTLDLRHIRRNMGPPNFRGVWYPCLNL